MANGNLLEDSISSSLFSDIPSFVFVFRNKEPAYLPACNEMYMPNLGNLVK